MRLLLLEHMALLLKIHVRSGKLSESKAQQVQERNASFGRCDLSLGLLHQKVCDRLQLAGLHHQLLQRGKKIQLHLHQLCWWFVHLSLSGGGFKHIHRFPFAALVSALRLMQL